ncbi:MAG: peptidase domain-containing ABC transporter [Planctomycetota bacterium]|nr:peptidase domain-containing ABC transporter [Planctomycetota bacterium]
MPTRHEAVRKVLDNHFIFSRLTEEGKRGLEPLFEVEQYNAGDVIAESGQPMTGIYSVYSGSVRLKGVNEDGKRVSLGEQPEDSTFGEIALLRDANWEYQVVAATDAILIKLPVGKLRQFVRTNPALDQHLQKQVGVVELRKRLRGILGSAQYSPELAAEILNNIGVKKIPKGKYVFKQNEDDPRLYYIESGAVELTREMLEGTAVLEKVSKGSLIGEEAALAGKPQTYSALAVTDVTVLVIRQPEVQKILQTNFELKEKLEQRVRQLRERERDQASAIGRAEGADMRIRVDAITEAEFKAGSGAKEIETFRIIYQHSESECAPACLAMITQHYGRNFSLGQIREIANIHATEALLPDVCNAAEAMGFRAKPFQCPYNVLQQLQLPCIILWENYHYMVLYRVKDNVVYLADPEKGLRIFSRKDFEAGWDGIVVVIEPTQKFRLLEPPANPWARFIAYLLPYKSHFAEALVAALVINLLSLATPLFIQNIVDKVVVHKDRGLLNMMLVGMALVAIFKLITGATQNLLIAHTMARVDLSLMAEFYRHILSLPMRFFQGRQIGDILTRFGENQKIRAILAGSTITVVLNTLMVVIYFLMMRIYSPSLTWLVAFFIPLYVANTVFFIPRIKKVANEIFLSNAAQQSFLIESLAGIEAIKSTGNEYWARARWENAFVERVNMSYRQAKMGLAFDTVSQLLNLTATIAILWVGANEVMDGKMSVGELMGFNMLMGAVMGPVMQFVGLFNSFSEIRIAMDRVNDINNIKPEQQPMTTPERISTIMSKCEGRVEFRNVKFRYGGEESPLILNEFALTIDPGQTVALVGPSGCGKSTVIKMILGFNLPTTGECLVDGKDITSLDFISYRRQVGVVMQDSFLFSETVAGNIALGDTSPDMNAVREAARLSSADDFIVRMPLGYQTLLGEKGIKVSGGQRQRICIARALYRRPKILIFDEATSALDNESEQRIQQNMKSILSGKTAIVIAHRLSTVRDSDYICFCENGKVMEKGTHDELVEQKGRYYQMAKRQFNLA